MPSSFPVSLPERSYGAGDLDGVRFIGDLTRTDFSHAKMTNTHMYRADFSGSTLVGVDLPGADALLIDADLTNANLTNAHQTGANLQGAKGLATVVRTGTRGLPGGT